MPTAEFRIGPTAVFVVVLALSVVAASTAIAQQTGKVYRIGYLAVPRRPPQADDLEPFLQELRNLGYAEGKNLIVERRYSEGKNERLPDLAGELLQRQVDVLVTFALPGHRGGRRRTQTTRSSWSPSPTPWSRLHRQLRPSWREHHRLEQSNWGSGGEGARTPHRYSSPAVPIGALFNPDDRGSALALQTIEEVARPRNVAVQPVTARRPEELTAAFATLTRQPPDALRVSPHLQFLSGSGSDPNRGLRPDASPPHDHRGQAVRGTGAPAVHAPQFSDLFRRGPPTWTRSSRGPSRVTSPSSSQQRSRWFINLKTAKALGLTIPQSVLLRADEVIQ